MGLFYDEITNFVSVFSTFLYLLTSSFMIHFSAVMAYISYFVL
jgi:hypothetical protein